MKPLYKVGDKIKYLVQRHGREWVEEHKITELTKDSYYIANGMIFIPFEKQYSKNFLSVNDIICFKGKKK